MSRVAFTFTSILAVWTLVQYVQKDGVSFLIFLACTAIWGVVGTLCYEGEQRAIHAARQDAMRRHPAGSALR